MTAPDKGGKEELKGICLRGPFRSVLTLLADSCSIILRSDVSPDNFLLISSGIEPNHPIRGIGPLVLRGQRERHTVQGRQPRPIVPDFRTQEYLEQHQLQNTGRQNNQDVENISANSLGSIQNVIRDLQNQPNQDSSVE